MHQPEGLSSVVAVFMRIWAVAQPPDRFLHEEDDIERILALLMFTDPLIRVVAINRWEPVNQSTDLIKRWCATVGGVARCFRVLICLLSGDGCPLMVSHGLNWLFTCLMNADSPEDVLREDPNARELASLLMKTYAVQRNDLAASTEIWSKFNTLVDYLVRLGEPTAVELQAKISNL